MRFDWVNLTLGDVCEKITDGAHNSPKSVQNGKPMASVKDLTRFGVDLSEARLISHEDFDALVKQGCRPVVGDVLIAKDGNSALDTVCTVDKPLDAVLLSSVAILRPNKEKLDADFLKYYFCSKETIDYLKGNFISGAAIPRVVLKDFRKAVIKTPPIEKQREISRILRSLDNKIELNRQTNQTLEQMAQALFKSWFVYFEPVKAKMAAKQAGASAELIEQAAICAISGKTPEQLPQLDPQTLQQLKTTAALFPDDLVDSELGEIPEGWEVQVLENLIIPKKGKNITKSTITDGDVPVVAGGLSPAYYHNEHNVPAPVITISASGANAGFVNLYHQHIWASDCSFVSKLEFEYLYSAYLFFKSRQEEITKMQQGAAQPHVYPKDLARLVLAVPPKRLWSELENIVSSFFEKIKSNLNEVENLQSLRDSLLPKLLSGELSLDLSQTTSEYAI